MKMRDMIFAAAFAVASTGAAWAQTSPATPASGQPPLTCSFIAQECMKGCGATAPQFFCSGYCDGNRKTCMETGTWSDMFQKFENVKRE